MEMRKLGNEELHRLSVAQYKETPKIPVIVVLDNIRSLNNIGSVFRTADAFCIQKIYLCGITATPPHKEIHKTALGATESVEWEYVQDITTVSREPTPEASGGYCYRTSGGCCVIRTLFRLRKE